MSELKLEDLNAGDKLEFVSEGAKVEFLSKDEFVNSIVPLGDKVVSRIFINNSKNYGYIIIHIEGYRGFYEIKVRDEYIKYFKKVENTKLSDDEVQDLRQDLKDSYSEFEQLDKEIPYVLVDAGIKDYVESYTRQMAGERFMFGDKQMWFDSKYGNFMCDDKLAGPYKSDYPNFKVKKPWYETASESNPILCKVWNDDKSKPLYVKVISKGRLCYITERGNTFTYATPVKASECFDG